ncbi:hypothetical protein A2311_03865 [candidate division WOR-1 bacterium RIFOXYB2_FULL_48_7]|uniref:KilA-N DNA-binding domain-containing protein n=1 Tax=candidate division WOR-1 bacterium RIFOXYB2_FULL_48_7 TaxID=1802583 RepID=A0A1F4T9B0_UNCSA|nr:MAG: hypothetical protein A2311_03865 [candidate division WOR-1 bacterium RIFOXYB2_FULL_48_7]
MSKLVGVSEIQEMIIELRGKKVIIDSDVAILYQVSTKRLMEQVKRNLKRFPLDFMFQLSKEEWHWLKSQIATSARYPFKKRKLPFAFTRNGANMISTILRSSPAIRRSIQIMRAFSLLEELLKRGNKLPNQSTNVLASLSTHSRTIMHLFQQDKIKTKELLKIKRITNEMINLLQRLILKGQ